MANILVTGGAGYLGTTLVKLLLANNHKVRVLDRCFFGEKTLEDVKINPHFELIKGDIRWPAKEIFDDIDVLIDLAGLSNDSACALTSDLTTSINRDGAIYLTELAKESGVKQMIYSSSCSVYGSGGDSLLDETSPCHPVSLYAECKLMIEEYLLHTLCDHNFVVTILRNGTLYGISDRMRFDLLVNVMTARAYKEGKIFVNGGGQQWRPLVHVEDACQAFFTVLDAPKELINGQVFNVGSDEQNFRVITVANMVHDIFYDTELINVPEDEDIRSYRVSFEKIKTALNFTPERNVPASIIEIRDHLKDGSLRFTGELDDPTATTNRYILLTKDDPMLEEKEKNRMRRTVEFYKHNIDEKDIAKVVRTLHSTFLTTGDVTKKFEESFAEYLGVKNVIGTASCTDALFIALKALEVGEGDEIITTPMSFVATSNAVEHCGATPVFVDVEPETGNINVDLIEDAITEKTKAILPVHLYGHMCDMQKISEVAKKHSLAVVEDCAHCIEGQRDGIKPGQLSDTACFSFYATKNITCGEGGALATNNEDLAEQLVKMRLHGMSADASSRYTGGFKHWDMELLGYKANMSNIDASLLIGQLARIEQTWERKEAISRKYETFLTGVQGIRYPIVLENTKSARHLFTIWVNPNFRDEIIQFFKSEGVGVAVNYRPIHLMKYYASKYGYEKGTFPIAERIGEATISIPLYPKLFDAEVNYVLSVIDKVAKQFK